MRILALVSGGMDSPVAALILRREGHEVDLLHFLGHGPPPLYLKNLLGGARMYAIPHSSYMEDVVSKLRARGRTEWTCVLCKYFMLRIAETLALREGYEALATGDSLGQVASQTLKNLVQASRGLRLPVLRPLLGMDKADIERLARGWSIMERYLAEEHPPCPYLPKAVVTRASDRAMDRVLSLYDGSELIRKALTSVRTL